MPFITMYLVVIDVPYDSSAPLLISISEQTTVRDTIGYEVFLSGH